MCTETRKRKETQGLPTPSLSGYRYSYAAVSLYVFGAMVCYRDFVNAILSNHNAPLGCIQGRWCMRGNKGDGG
jgi:hypothetical protein